MSKKNALESGSSAKRYGVELRALTPNIVSEIMLIFARTAAEQPEFFLNPEYTQDTQSLIKLAFDPAAALKEIQIGVTDDPINPIVISSFYSLPEEGVLFKKVNPQSTLLDIKYEPGEWYHLITNYEDRNRRFTHALNSFLLGQNIAVPIE